MQYRWDMGMENKRKLNKYNLDFSKSIGFFSRQLKTKNELCLELFDNIDFSKGSFFTFLIEGSFIERLYDFDEGILPQNPEITYESGGKFYTYSFTPHIIEEIAAYIYDLILNSNLLAIFDDVTRKSTDMHLEYFYQNKLIYEYKNKLYYLINKNNLNHDFIVKVLHNSNAIWHSLCVLSEVVFFENQSHELSQEMLQTISKTARILMVGAYDGEGYIFWEKNR